MEDHKIILKIHTEHVRISLENHIIDAPTVSAELTAVVMKNLFQNNDIISLKYDLVSQNNNLAFQNNDIVYQNNKSVSQYNDIIFQNNETLSQNDFLSK